MKFTVTYGKCGHVGVVDLDYKNHEYWVSRYEREGYCPECQAKRREERKLAECKAAYEHAAAHGLPQMTDGTQKMIDWAMVIRYRLAQIIDERRHLATDYPNKYVADACDYAITRITSARRWIDETDGRRETTDDLGRLVNPILQALMQGTISMDDPLPDVAPVEAAKKNVEETPAEAEKPAVDDVVSPAYPDTDTVITIDYDGKEIHVMGGYIRTANMHYKQQDYTYNGSTKTWHKPVDDEDAVDQIVRLGKRLMSIGIPVRIPNDDAREKIKNK